ncbi:MAG: long-chain fatty acid--CoA ligase [Candidatus Bathyarchaeota archaeon]|uniref:long-chain-fatty-acid--CoA ligase n=1 Tax=Candidatus Bathycorpusculum sp. TaxID=2994959 RepID=UPI00282EF6DB|nr:long-chain fatty acid--CoA ligase [Candidatus Termiticorpusculum sp.]MCL2258034.1 long-chain fatty acid--CoA ligase [Candidatus Termiticorpusculum sp.]MCL2291746.1 long-chain fatty acid--CoA ligase [Candidatus Termiticorpusculum sp.]
MESKSANRSQVTLQALLSQTAVNFPEKTAIIYDNQKFTYKELEEFSSRFACALIDLGVKKGDRVALFLFNSPQFVITYFGALKAGAVVTTINPLHSEREVEEQICDSGAQIIVVTDTLYRVVNKILHKTLLHNVIVTNVNIYSNMVNVKTDLNVQSLWELIKKNPSNPMLVLQLDPEVDLAVLQYTGGTTGVPKGVMLTHANLVSNARAFASWLNVTSKDVFLSVLPLFHVYGMTASMNTPISSGAEMVLLSKFDSAKSLQAIAQYQVTIFCGSPTMYARILESLEFKKCNLSSVRACISGAAPLPTYVQEQFIQARVFLVEGYGLTEASPITHCTPISTLFDDIKIGSIGVPLPGTEARIVDLETGNRVLLTGEKGELTIRGPQVMRGYWQRTEETLQVLKDNWLRTGDIAYVDKDGYFYIVDRKKDLIKHNDYSIYPRELEKILYAHPDVKLCTIVGKPDQSTGETIKAFIVLKENSKITNTKKEEILEFVNSKTATYKAIKEIEFLQDLPISSSDKIVKRALNYNQSTDM